MPEETFNGRKDRPDAQYVGTLVQIALIWILADLGYYLVLPELGIRSSYNVGPLAIALYYFIVVAPPARHYAGSGRAQRGTNGNFQ